jgi:predicted transcriptional regulator
MKTRKFKIKIADPNDKDYEGTFRDIEEKWKLAEQGRLHEYPYDLVLTLPSMMELTRIFSPERMRIIVTVRDQKPESIYQLAKILGRAIGNVRRDVDDLAQLGIIRLKKKRTKVQGREALQPQCDWTEFDVAV